ncbi:MAG: Stk1 family PASTA domain-containing Ser/Thr kinase [Oscillospiraceae bacterium]|nr:Stk1 family PASTA domain-containing Ser/Thr kinase [Oscillospiraceae bacterium]
MNSYIGMKLDGRYELLELIGAGGMAEIYKAADTTEDRTVAVKILRNEFAGSDDFLRRFRNECKAVALLTHPNIVKIYDSGFNDTPKYLVMEYVDGITLTEYITRQGVLKWKEAHSYVTQILKALQYAHDRGIVHRDVKSQNVMLLRDGSIKVMDFGIARFNREIDKSLSEKAIGSVHYISPEQARGENTDEKSDLYSVGVMMYEMLTGVKPFDGDDALKIAMMHTNARPKAPREINASIPGALEEIIFRAMQKNSLERYQASGEMLGDLQEFEKNPGIVFEYKYSTPSGEAKHVDKAGKPAPNAAAAALAGGAAASGGAKKNVKDTGAAAPKASVFDDDDDDDEYDDDEIAERRSPLLPILFAVASAFVIVAAILITYVVSEMLDGKSNNRDMPNLVGRPFTEVNAEFYWLRLNATQDYSADFPVGHVIRQSVRSGQLFNPEQTVVQVVVSKGQQTASMPPFDRSNKREDIKIALENLGLIPLFLEEHDPDVPLGHFISSDHVPGDLIPVGTQVRIRLSLGRIDDANTTTIPNFMGMDNVEADYHARLTHLLPEFEFVESPEEQRGRIINQMPPHGGRVNRGTIVVLTIGKGPATGGESFIRFEMPEIATGLFDFSLLNQAGELIDQKSQHMGINRIVLFEFEGTGVAEYSVHIRNPQNGRDGIYVTYHFDFEKEPVEKTMVGEPNIDLMLELIPPQVPTTPPTLPPTEPPTTPSEEPSSNYPDV